MEQQKQTRRNYPMTYSGGSATRNLRKKPNPDIRDLLTEHPILPIGILTSQTGLLPQEYSGGSATRNLRKKPNPEVRDSSLKIPRLLSSTFLGFRWEPIEPQETQGTLVQFLMVSWRASLLGARAVRSGPGARAPPEPQVALTVGTRAKKPSGIEPGCAGFLGVR